MIQDLTEMMVERLQAYKATNKALPKRVIIYRDGVSEVSTFEHSRSSDLFMRGDRDNTTTYSTRSSVRTSSSLSGWRAARVISQRSPLSSVGSDITADSTPRRPTKNRTTVTHFPARSKTEVSRPRSYSTSIFKHIPVFKGMFDQPTTSSFTTRITSAPI